MQAEADTRNAFFLQVALNDIANTDNAVRL